MTPLRHWQQPAAQDPTMLHCAQQRGRPDAASPTAETVIVDTEPFFASSRAMAPYLSCDESEPTRERRQSPTRRTRSDDTTKATIANAHRFIFDSRDTVASERLEMRQGSGDNQDHECLRLSAVQLVYVSQLDS